MPNYFKPRRRKIGVLTLLMACVAAVGWTRSLHVKDEFLFQRKASDDRLVVINGTIAWGARGIVYEELSEELRQEWKKAVQERERRYDGWFSTSMSAEEVSHPVTFQWLDWFGFGQSGTRSLVGER